MRLSGANIDEIETVGNPLVYGLLIGVPTALGGGIYLGHRWSQTGFDPKTGMEKPSVIEQSANTISEGVANAATWAAILGISYLILKDWKS